MDYYIGLIQKIAEKDRAEVQFAWLTAKYYFKGITDRGGKPYIEHLERVSYNAVCEDSDYKVAIVGLLHDLFEDIEYVNKDNIRDMFGDEIYEGILCMTKNPNEQYQDYLKRVNSNRLSKIVKKHDLEDNMDLSRLSNPKQEDLNRTEKYKEALVYLKK